MKRILCLAVAAALLIACFGVNAFAKESERILALAERFTEGAGPEVNGISIDYLSYSPKAEKGVKYPLLILLHGMGQGKKKGDQIVNNDFPAFAGEEMQSRFTNGAAYLFIPRSDESGDPYGTWTNDEVEPLYSAISGFISENRAHIDTTRIYIGGYSMGGKMVLKMISSYPGMFAAAFPMCPAYIPDDEQIEAVADMPLWVSCSRYDVIGGYHVFGKYIWEQICRITRVPGSCRLSVFATVCYPDGKKTPSNHHVWFAASNDMFSYEGGDYPNMETFGTDGEKIKLTYPDGLISWLNGFTSSYTGDDVASTNLVEENTSTVWDMGKRILKGIGYEIADTFRALSGMSLSKEGLKEFSARLGIK